ncbi:MAG: helix-turn-helix domain-containing protein [Prevotella sp.]|jgi:transcriptional regulator with XRE-family HTH domain|nr:helix-turn-helix domain-containing protein [Prevotella sp.]
MDTIEKNTHHGHAVKRFRKSLDMKQETLAELVGLSQPQISCYESKKEIEDDMIEKFAKALKVDPKLIKELEVDPVSIIIENNTFEKGSVGSVVGENTVNNNPDPVERIIELSNEKTALYERMMKLEQEKIELLEKLLKEKK